MINYDKAATEWTPVQQKDFSISVRAWKSVFLDQITWHWNVYAHIFETHPLFSNVEAALNLPFHCGATYEQLITHEPAQGIKYNFQKIVKCLKLSSDYAHLYDDFEECDPIDGVPSSIKSDIESLFAALNNYCAGDTEGEK